MASSRQLWVSLFLGFFKKGNKEIEREVWNWKGSIKLKRKYEIETEVWNWNGSMKLKGKYEIEKEV